VSLLDGKGTPNMVERAWILPPSSRIGPITPQEREQVIKSSPVYGHYEQAVDRESAYEKLAPAGKPRMETTPASGQAPGAAPAGGGVMDVLGNILLGSTGPRGGHKDGMLEAAAKSAARSVGSQVGREIMRGVLGGLLGGRKR
jgi:uncharacterized protein